MTFTTRMIIPAAAVVLALGASPVMAQDAPAPAPAPAEQQQPAPAPGGGQAQAQSVEGELLRVDAETKLIWVRAEGKEQQFRFSDDTEITGAGRNVEGLSTMTGTNVTVHYKVEGGANVATKIDIQARANQPAPAPAPQPQQ